jgi:hypothetical protein
MPKGAWPGRCTDVTTDTAKHQPAGTRRRRSITNLISLCDSHHWLVHEGGWHITTHKTGWLFHDTDHRAIPTTPPAAPSVDPLSFNETIATDAVTGKWDGTGLDLPLATSLLLDRESQAG